MDKHHILSEIARTAAGNGGVALGRERFFQETGIKSSDWIGRFWARWSDAVKEAGSIPNQFRAPLEEEVLFESYISLVREIGHLPVVNELKLKATQSPGFPSHNTFRRFGTKKEQIGKLVEYCKARPGYEDVLELAGSQNLETERSTVEGRLPELPIGFVYLLRASRHFKIGRSSSFERRERELSIQLPEKAVTVHVIRTDDPVGIELYWHRRFESKRKNGEWFELNAQDVQAFKRRKFM